MKKIAVIGTVGLPANYGGFETLVNHIVKNLGRKYAFTVYCTTKRYRKEERKNSFMNARLKYIPLEANGVQSVLYDSLSILHALFYADVLLVLGVAGAWVLPFVYLFTNKKIIVSIDGIEWKRQKWNGPAKLYLWIAEKIAVKFSHIDISDNEAIQDYTAVRYGTLSRIIEYGGDHIMKVESTDNDHEKYPFLKYLYAVKVCRIEPENNVHEVLKAFSEVNKMYFVIIGNWSNSKYGRELKEQYSSCTNIFMIDPIYDQRTLDLIRGNAILYIHGHSAGGTNPSLVEAMCLGLPVIAYDVSYNRATTENKALFFKTAEDLRDRIDAASFESLKRNAEIMKRIAAKRYNWSLIADKYDMLILECIQKRTKNSLLPDVVRQDYEILKKYNAAHLKNVYLFYEKTNH